MLFVSGSVCRSGFTTLGAASSVCDIIGDTQTRIDGHAVRKMESTKKLGAGSIMCCIFSVKELHVLRSIL